MTDKNDIEKVEVVDVTTKYAQVGVAENDAAFFQNYPEEKHRLRKVDFRLVPFLALLYLAAHIDRANIGNAKIEGLLDDLQMSGIQYNVA